MAALTIKNVDKNFGETKVLKNISLDIQDGEFVILVGPSGCGKSTLLNCIAGLEEVTQGDISIGEVDVTRVAPKDRDIAMVFQSYALYPNMTVRKNIAFGLEIQKVDKKTIEQDTARVAELLQITHLLDRKPSQLSGGQRQRVAMGRALARHPKIFLFDEPLSNLDAKLRVEMRTEIKKLHHRLNTTIVYVTHDQIEAMTLADRIAVLKDGILQQFDDPQTIYDEPVNIFVAGFMGSPSMNFLDVNVVEQNGRLCAEIESKGVTHALPIPERLTFMRDQLGKQVTLGIRPEQITHEIHYLNEHPDTLNVPCLIEMVEPTGADTLVLTHINGKEVTCRVHPTEAGRVGETQSLMFNMEKAVFFDPQTELRLT
jgi:multiple sugar transport system ATP-binding protein